MARRRRTPFGLYLLALAALCWTALQWVQYTDTKWQLHRFDHKGVVWTNHTGEVLFLSAKKDILSGFRLAPEQETVIIRDVTIAYDGAREAGLLPDEGKGELFEDLER